MLELQHGYNNESSNIDFIFYQNSHNASDNYWGGFNDSVKEEGKITIIWDNYNDEDVEFIIYQQHKVISKTWIQINN